MNMDYALCQALNYKPEGITRTLVFYDIMCQYWKRFFQRVNDSPYLNIPDGMEFQRAIGLFHVHGHQDSCLYRFAPNFIKGAGQVDGEILETLWAPLNKIASSTRSMTKAHRQEIIDVHMNDSNWKKLVGMGMRMSFVSFTNTPAHQTQLIHCVES